MANKDTHPEPDQLQAHLDQALDSLASREIELHLEGCDRCRDDLARLEALVARLENLPELALDRDLAQGVISRLREETKLSPGLTWTLVFEALAAGLALGLAVPVIQAASWLPRLLDVRRGLLAAANLFWTQLASSWIYCWHQLNYGLKGFFGFQGIQNLLPIDLPASWILVLTAAGLGLLVNYLLLGRRPAGNYNHNTQLN